MFSAQWPQPLALAIKGLALLAGVAAALIAWRAARLWMKASKVEIESFTEPPTSIGDDPGGHVLNAYVQVFHTQEAFHKSAVLNASAARWTGWAAILTGVAAVLGIV